MNFKIRTLLTPLLAIAGLLCFASMPLRKPQPRQAHGRRGAGLHRQRREGTDAIADRCRPCPMGRGDLHHRRHGGAGGRGQRPDHCPADRADRRGPPIRRPRPAARCRAKAAAAQARHWPARALRSRAARRDNAEGRRAGRRLWPRQVLSGCRSGALPGHRRDRCEDGREPRSPKSWRLFGRAGTPSASRCAATTRGWPS